MPRAVVGPRAVVKPGASSSHGTEGLECAAPESATMPPLATADVTAEMVDVEVRGDKERERGLASGGCCILQ